VPVLTLILVLLFCLAVLYVSRKARRVKIQIGHKSVGLHLEIERDSSDP
jgi:hypothetical protein